MPTTAVSAADVVLVGWFLAALVLPGLALGVAAGLRGWVLAAAAPLLSYAAVGLAGPWTSALGLPWSAPVMAGSTAVLALALASVRLAAGRLATQPKPPAMPAWSRAAHAAAAAGVAAGAVAGAAAVLRGVGRLGAVPQDWDAVFHANGIRWIADTGDATLFGMSQVNWYEPGTAIYYPNAYHLLSALVRRLSGAELPAVLNAHTVLIPGMAALVLAALVRRLGGSVVHVVGTALAVVSATALYDMFWRGPLLPYATGVALTPVIVLLMAEYLDGRGVPNRLRYGAVMALGVAGLLCLHPAMLFGAALFVLPYLAARWLADRSRLRREPLLLGLAGIGALVLCTAQVSGALYSATSFPAVDWAADLGVGTAVRQLLAFGHDSPTVQVWLAAAVLVGAVTLHRMRGLRWVAGPVLAAGVLFVLAASSDAAWVETLTRPWWNDRWRFATLFALAACVLAGHGVTQAQRAGLWLLRRAGRGAPLRAGDRAVMAAVAVVGFVVLSNGLYLERSAERVALGVGEGPALSSNEVAALQALGRIVPPGVRVLNDRNDGSAWMYALSGARPVAGHYDATGLGGSDVELLATRFNRYADDAAVRAAVRRLDVGYVVVANGFLRREHRRAPGLIGLAGAPFLRAVYRNPDVVVYEVVPVSGPLASNVPLPAVALGIG